MRFLAYCGLLVMILSLSAVGASAADGCTQSKCHDKMAVQEWVHGPVGAGACSVCHRTVEGEEHTFEFPASQSDLCFACHDDRRDMMMQDSVHSPVLVGDCVGCHDPHQSDHRYTLKASTAELCFVCHEEAGFQGTFVHAPVKTKDCNACHDPHASPYANQLRAEPSVICLDCHEEQGLELQMRHVHAPVADNCANCHMPHASAEKYLLPDQRPQLCYGCHTDVEESATAAISHLPVVGGNCSECHQAHGSDHPRLFPVSPERLCFRCHTELSEYVDAQTNRHGPVSQGDCNACHDAHGSAFHGILRKDFPEEFYTGYADDKYSMCFECHNQDIAHDEITKTLTDFRDGDQNLHFLHVNKAERGRSCRACHQVHASSQAKHVRTSVPYGEIDWELPVEYTKTEDGGSCVVGCHAPKEYKR